MDILCFLSTLLWVYSWVLFARIVLSWVSMLSSWSPPPGLAPVVRMIYEVTDPPMDFLRRFIPPVGGLDLSALVLFLLINLTRSQLPC